MFFGPDWPIKYQNIIIFSLLSLCIGHMSIRNGQNNLMVVILLESVRIWLLWLMYMLVRMVLCCSIIFCWSGLHKNRNLQESSQLAISIELHMSIHYTVWYENFTWNLINGYW